VVWQGRAGDRSPYADSRAILLLHYFPPMSDTFCEVALPVPLRKVFTYAVPEHLAGMVCAGSRVLVPFRKRAMPGVVVGVSNRRPDPALVKEVREIAELVGYVRGLSRAR